MGGVLQDLKKYPVIAAIRDIEKVDLALEHTVQCIFLLTGTIFDIKYVVKHIKRAGKRAFIHIDLLEGVSKDSMGIRYVAQEIKPDGIITTRGNLVGSAKSEGIFTIQRVFILDSLAKDSADKSIKQVDPDAVEVLPGAIPKIIRKIHNGVRKPLIAGGLIENINEVQASINAGAFAVSVSSENLWELNNMEKRAWR